MRKTKFQNEYYYHIYNRGVDKRNLFMDGKDYARFLESMREFNTPNQIDSLYRHKQLKRKQQEETEFLRFETNRRNSVSSPQLVSIICYCLIPNHYHLMLRQETEKGIAKFLHKLSLAYTKYFNAKYNRIGSLFGGPYKSVPVKTESHWLRTSCYINGNAEIHGIVNRAEDWPYSSYRDFLNLRSGTLCHKQAILKEFKSIQEYKELTNYTIKESRQLKFEIRNYCLE